MSRFGSQSSLIAKRSAKGVKVLAPFKPRARLLPVPQHVRFLSSNKRSDESGGGFFGRIKKEIQYAKEHAAKYKGPDYQRRRDAKQAEALLKKYEDKKGIKGVVQPFESIDPSLNRQTEMEGAKEEEPVDTGHSTCKVPTPKPF